jgi:hypothetical protein
MAFVLNKDPSIRRALGVDPPPLHENAYVESTAPSSFAFQQLGIQTETETVVPINRGEILTTVKGNYNQVQVDVVTPFETFKQDIVVLDIGAGSTALKTVNVDDAPDYTLSDEDRARLAQQAADAAAYQVNSYTGQAAQEYVPPAPPETAPYVEVQTPEEYQAPQTGRQQTETTAPYVQPEAPAVTHESAPTGGCETRVIHYFDDSGGDYFYEEHSNGSGWDSVG